MIGRDGVKSKFLVALFIIVVIIGSVLMNNQQQEKMDMVVYDAASESLFPELNKIAEDGINKLESYSFENIISDIDNEEFNATSKLVDGENGNIVLIDVELKKFDLIENVEIIKTINQKMNGLSSEGVVALFIDYSTSNEDIATFAFDLLDNDQNNVIILWFNKYYETEFKK